MKKNEVLIHYLREKLKDVHVTGEYMTDQSEVQQIIVREQTGNKVVFFGNIDPLYNYFEIICYGNSIKEEKEMAEGINMLIGKNEKFKIGKSHWQIIFKQASNAQAIEFKDIRRVGYTMILQCIVNKFYEEG